MLLKSNFNSVASVLKNIYPSFLLCRFAMRTINKKILIESLHGIGDFVCILPLLKEIRLAYPDYYITLFVNNNCIKDILECSRIKIDNIICVNYHINFFKFLKTCFSLRKEKYAISISSANTSVLKTRMLMWIINATHKYGIQYTLKTNFDGLNDQYHFVEANKIILKQMNIIDHHFCPCVIPFIDDLDDFLFFKNSDAICICIGRADSSYTNKLLRLNRVYTRGWGDLFSHVMNLSQLIQMLLDIDKKVILCGGNSELLIRDRMNRKILTHPYCYDFVGKLSIKKTIALFNCCKVVFGVDTGMMHVAAAVGVNTVSIFGPTNPSTHGPYSKNNQAIEVDMPCKYCYGSDKYVLCKHRSCLKNISVDSVFKTILNRLNILNNVMK